ncbi:UNVERIFIED_ORG: hypothetical protein LHK14_00485 [Roseateles sp. XES5]|nr:hypothetical protein [Roseateles sp. XES5]
MIAAILAELQKPGTPFRIAGGAGELADVKDQPPALPAVYAYLARERSEPSDRTVHILQRTACDIGVVIVTSNLSATNNAAAASDIDVLKTYVRATLLGFVPASGADPIEHVEGELQQALSGTVWFEDIFATAYYQESQT